MHRGIEILFDGWRHRIDLAEFTGGRAITIYPQHEVFRDLVKARQEAGGHIVFEARSTPIRRPRSSACGKPSTFRGG